MKIKTLLAIPFLLGALGMFPTAQAAFDFGPMDWFDNDDDYYSYRNGPRNFRGDRWRRYDEWEPNYWRYRYFDDESDDYIFDNFDGNGRGRGRGRFNFGMDSRIDSDYDGRYRGNSGSRYRYDSRRDSRYYPDQYRNQSYNRGRNNNRYNDNYSSPTIDSNGRRMSNEYQSYDSRRDNSQSVECR